MTSGALRTAKRSLWMANPSNRAERGTKGQAQRLRPPDHRSGRICRNGLVALPMVLYILQN